MSDLYIYLSLGLKLIVFEVLVLPFSILYIFFPPQTSIANFSNKYFVTREGKQVAISVAFVRLLSLGGICDA